jgi:hypothetical protein
MNSKQINFMVAALLFAGFEAFQTAFAPQVAAREPNEVQGDSAWIDARVAAWQPTKTERAFDEIGWVRNLTEAERLAQEHRRPIFLFTYDGSDLACFRC